MSYMSYMCLMQNLPLLITPGRPIRNVRSEPICDKTLAQAHRYVLYNCDAIARFIKYVCV